MAPPPHRAGGGVRLSLDLANLVGALGGLLYASLGAFVLRLRPRTRANAAFGWFAILFGGSHLLAGMLALALPGLAGAFTASMIARTVSGIGYAVATPFLLAVGLRFPAPLTRLERRHLALPALVGGGYAMLGATGYLLLTPGAFSGTLAIVETVGSLGGILFLGAEFFVLVLLPMRYAAAADGRARRQLALMAVAFALHVGALLARFAMSPEAPLPAAVMTGGAVALVTAMWLAAARLPQDGRIARDVAWIHLAIPLGAMLLHALDFDSGILGASRAAAVVVLAYAILKHQLLGIDVRLRWTASRSTVAAAFVAVFFVVSETAASLVGDLTRSNVLGIAAAGMLVFVLAPMQRAADRLMGLAPERGDEPTGERLYSTAMRLALRDGRMTPEEELDLAELAERLGVGTRRAAEIRQHVAREVMREGASSSAPQAAAASAAGLGPTAEG